MDAWTRRLHYREGFQRESAQIGADQGPALLIGKKDESTVGPRQVGSAIPPATRRSEGFTAVA